MKAGARADAVLGYLGEAVKVSVRAPRERGKANAGVVDLLAGALGVGRAAVRIVGGASSSSKVVEVEGLDAAACRARLLRAAAG